MQQLIKIHTEMHQTVGKIIDAKEINDNALANQEKDKVMQYSQQILNLIDDLKEEISKEVSVPTPKSNLAPALQTIPKTIGAISNLHRCGERCQPKTARPGRS